MDIVDLTISKNFMIFDGSSKKEIDEAKTYWESNYLLPIYEHVMKLPISKSSSSKTASSLSKKTKSETAHHERKEHFLREIIKEKEEIDEWNKKREINIIREQTKMRFRRQKELMDRKYSLRRKSK
ncbi:hypothetical protein SNEBB_000536 [Seison nebaliae]|nr:hypothetical protein SNEBB_000536 [Seison nebaliae]